MSAFVVLNIQSTLSLIVFGLIAAWFVMPRLAKLDSKDALVVLALVHVFRYTPLTLFVPGQVSEMVPAAVSSAIAYGDLTSGILALVAVLLLRYRITGAVLAAWVFNIVGVADIIMALVQGVTAHLYEFELGFNWYILTYYVPMLIVTHFMMIRILLSMRHDNAGAV